MRSSLLYHRKKMYISGLHARLRNRCSDLNISLYIRDNPLCDLRVVVDDAIHYSSHCTKITFVRQVVKRFRPSSKIVLPTVPRRYFFCGSFMFFCIVFVMPLCTSVYLCLVVTCWEWADLLARVCHV